MGQANLACVGAADFAGFEEIDRFTQNLAEVATVHLINDQDERLFLSAARGVQQPARADVELEGSCVGVGCQADDEILVRHSRVELHRHAMAGEMAAAHFFSKARLASAGRALDDDEAPSPQKIVDFICARSVEEGSSESTDESLAFAFEGLEGLPATFVRI